MQWLIVALIGLVAVWNIARHFGLGQKNKGHACPGCGGCEAAKQAQKTHAAEPR